MLMVLQVPWGSPMVLVPEYEVVEIDQKNGPSCSGQSHSPRYHDARKSRKDERLDAMSDDVLKVLFGALGGAVLALLLVGASPAGT
jgi:hypothetical protein